MTELAVHQPATPAPVDLATTSLHEWAKSAQAAGQVAEALARSSFVPQAFRNKPDEIMSAILAGVEVGLQPMAALQAFDIIQGRAAARAITLRALLQSRGHEIELTESTATRCKMRGRRKGATAWQEVVWTMDRARELGLTGKDNWKKQPQTMLVARATSELARLIASDAILGLGYSVEEIADGADPETTIETTGIEPEQKTLKWEGATKSQPTDELPIEAELIPPPEVDEMASDAQGRKIAVLMRENGIEEPAAIRAAISGIIGREIKSRTELTKAEAHQVIDTMEPDTEGATE